MTDLPYSPDAMPRDDPDSVDDTTFEQLDEADILDGDAPEAAPEDPLDEGDEGYADDIGVDGAGASAEEAAMHTVEDDSL